MRVLKLRPSNFKFDGGGSCFKQEIRVDQGTMDKLQDCIRAEEALKYPRAKEYSTTATNFLQPLSFDGDLAYMNLTTTRFINLFLKLDLADENTCIKVGV